MDKVIAYFDALFVNREYIELHKHDWQTLKTAVLAQQSNNSDYAAAIQVYKQYLKERFDGDLSAPFIDYCQSKLNSGE